MSNLIHNNDTLSQAEIESIVADYRDHHPGLSSRRAASLDGTARDAANGVPYAVDLIRNLARITGSYHPSLGTATSKPVILIGEPTNGASGFLAAAEAVLAGVTEAQRLSGKQIGPVAAAEQPSLFDELDLPIPYSLVEPGPDPDHDPEDEDEDEPPSIPECDVVDMFGGAQPNIFTRAEREVAKFAEEKRTSALLAPLLALFAPSIAEADVVDMFAGTPLPSLGWS